jgi:hypothetical protein
MLGRAAGRCMRGGAQALVTPQVPCTDFSQEMPNFAIELQLQAHTHFFTVAKLPPERSAHLQRGHACLKIFSRCVVGQQGIESPSIAVFNSPARVELHALLNPAML